MDIGEDTETYEFEPIETPGQEPTREPAPATPAEPDRELVPA